MLVFGCVEFFDLVCVCEHVKNCILSLANEYDEKELLGRIASGDEQAFRAVYDRYALPMYNNALRFTKQEDLAKDLTQEIFFRVWTNRARLTEVERFDSYLYVVARNCIFDELRRQFPLNGHNEFLESYLQYDSVTPQDNAEVRDLETRVMAAIRRLPPQMQTAFRLSRFEGLTHDQIAQRMKISSTTSKSYIVRALIAIRRQLAVQGEQLILILFLFPYFF